MLTIGRKSANLPAVTRKVVFLVSTVLFTLGLFASPALAMGNPHSMPDQAVANGLSQNNDSNGTGTPDEGDNEHPSGKDRSVEPGNSYPQGNAQSDPDDDGRGPDRTNGGQDQPGGPGGEDLEDQDRNNGCGNDDDFEDDNEGWCGGKPKGGPGDGDGDGGDGNGNGNGDEDGDGDGGVTPPQPTVKPGSVLGAVTSLPVTGIEDKGDNNLALILAFFLSGIGLHLYLRRREQLEKAD